MRSLFLLILCAASSHQWVNSDSRCISSFGYYRGWCVASGLENEVSYQDAVSFCSSKGAFAPSIHSKSDLDFWSGAIGVVTSYHFWLDAYCPNNGDNYRWRDGTHTDYLGPLNQLSSCRLGWGYHMHSDGLNNYDYGTDAVALCAYPAGSPPGQNVDTTIDPTTFAPAFETTPEPTPEPRPEPNPEPTDATDSYCQCEPSSTYLDIVFITDTSADMTTKTVSDASATIQSVLFGLSLGTEVFQSNVAALAYGDVVQVVQNFGGIRTFADIMNFNLPFLGGKATKMTDAIKQASSMISSNGRSYTRGVIVLLSKSYNQLDSTNIKEAAEAFQDDGGIFITIDYSVGQGIKGLEEIASAGFYLRDADRTDPLPADILYAFCDANCFCPDGLTPYNVPDSKGRELPQGCYHVADVAAVYEAADQNCQRQQGFVSTIHDDAKNFFMLSLFPGKVRFWNGLRVYGSSLQWADGSSDPFTWWAPSNPVNGQNCVYVQQTTGLNSKWYSAPCTDPLKNSLTYACQLKPCDSEYYCWT